MTTESMQRLADVIREQPPVALIGAGVSASTGAGYPLWPALLDKLHEAVASMMPDGEWPEEGTPPRWVRAAPMYLEQLRKMDDLLWRAEEYRRLIEEVDPGAYHGLIRETFAPRWEEGGPPPGRNGLLEELVRLPFRYVINTNYDPSLEDAYAAVQRGRRVVDWSDREALRGFLADVWSGSPQEYLVYLHGVYHRPQGVVLSERDYVERYMANDDASKKLFALFITHRVVFIGFSLADPELVYLLRVANAHLGQSKPRHFAFLPRQDLGNEEAVESTYKGKFGVEPIFYHPGDEHAELVRLLRALRTEGGGGAREAAGAGFAERPPPTSPDDPHKGRFGGSPVRNGLRLRAEVAEKAGDPDWFHVRMWVTREGERDRPFAGEVTFHLHPTFRHDTHTVRVRDGRAELECWAYGAFTVGVAADGGATRLELDLAAEPQAPQVFRER